jgi:hypothetical protein
VQGVEQVLGPEEAVAVDEFAKFVRHRSLNSAAAEFTPSQEARLRSEGKTVDL